MKTQPIKLNIEGNKKTFFGMVTNPFENKKAPKMPQDTPDANLQFLKCMHIKF